MASPLAGSAASSQWVPAPGVIQRNRVDMCQRSAVLLTIGGNRDESIRARCTV